MHGIVVPFGPMCLPLLDMPTPQSVEGGACPVFTADTTAGAPTPVAANAAAAAATRFSWVISDVDADYLFCVSCTIPSICFPDASIDCESLHMGMGLVSSIACSTQWAGDGSR